jgi:isopenicillin-N epimerase
MLESASVQFISSAILARNSTVHTLKHLFLLDPAVIFLNHGSFGATPRPVFRAYRAWQRRLERQPVLFLGRRLHTLLAEARRELGAYLGADAADLVFVPNATFGVNVVARSLQLGPGDEVLASDHEYGACDKTWEFLCRKTGATYRHQPIPLPIGSPAEILDHLWRGVTPRTRVIFLSHITSPTALTMPVAAVCARARQAGILTLIDGAHAPGQIPLNLATIGADFYVGNLHKWALSPKGAAFLYARSDRHALVEPLVVSWGWQPDQSAAGNSFVDLLEWWGTHDPAAPLSVPAAIRFQQEHDWPRVRITCHELLREAQRQLEDLVGMPAGRPDSSEWYAQMAAFPLPRCDAPALQRRLYDEYRVEVPIVEWNGRQLIRVSVQGYNTQEDLEALIGALRAVLPLG